ncbi:hypothetical protein F4561_002057 [Lipingzhangella halophila]|uniref:DUF1349 domain-containing protein n=1 Tax=Lipingzhangella halophila TaxID=1783352 RepID=A0A7W7RG16_9ACTN|nr:DUF1349 domain-containing protein [Lipingzhangella halophila]MBB4931237.1 hypothetical protein [Lipingzhangella halophila]
MTETVSIPAIPAPLRWLNEPEAWKVAGSDTLEVRAGGGTDLFTDPDGGARYANAPALLTRLEGDYLLSARVRLDLESTYDAAVLVLHADAQHWAKLCLESSPQGHPTIVSVVTRGVSDDCNSHTVDAEDVQLRIARLGPAFAFHARTGDGPWNLIRYFAPGAEPRVGFLAQSPLGQGRTVRFEAIQHSPQRLPDIRSGE